VFIFRRWLNEIKSEHQGPIDEHPQTKHPRQC
jgi:hypothetical protein